MGLLANQGKVASGFSLGKQLPICPGFALFLSKHLDKTRTTMCRIDTFLVFGPNKWAMLYGTSKLKVYSKRSKQAKLLESRMLFAKLQSAS